MPTFFEAFRSNNNEKLINAAKEGKVDIVNNLLDDKKRKVDINFQDKYGATALMYASEFGHSNVAKQLLEAGANKDLADKDGKTALMYASLYIAEQLLNAGANPDLADKDGITALMRASQYGHSFAVSQMLKAGANPDLADIKGLTALMGASACGNLDIVKQLLEKGANVDLADKDFRTALMYASEFGHSNVAKQLLEAGANKDLADKYGRTALMYASECGHPDVITQSLKKEAGNTAETYRYAGAQRDLTSAEKAANMISKGVTSSEEALRKVVSLAFSAARLGQQRGKEDIKLPLLGSENEEVYVASPAKEKFYEAIRAPELRAMDEKLYKAHPAPVDIESTLTHTVGTSPAASRRGTEAVVAPLTQTRQ